MTLILPVEKPHPPLDEGDAKGVWHSITGQNTALTISIIAVIAACLSIALQAPGQISMDTSVQLYEAHIGQSVSWNPPFMSALLHWLGGGSVATSMMVLINTTLLYGSFALTAVSIIQIQKDRGFRSIPTWRAGAAALVVMNPIVFLYAGIVWKDVLYASLLSSACALTIAASAGTMRRKYICGTFTILLLTAAMITRQQGIFMVPLIVIAVIVAMWPSTKKRGIYQAVAVLILFAFSSSMLQRQVDTTIKPGEKVSTSVGFRNIMIFDLAGIISKSERTFDDYAYPISEEQLRSIRAVYTPERVDTLYSTPLTQDWLGRLTSSELLHAWLVMVKQNPGSYIAHRFAAFSKLLGLSGLQGTLPIHIGVEGNTEYLSQVGIETGRTQRSQLIYDIARDFFSWPIYRHAFWLLTLVVVIAAGVVSKLPNRLRGIGGLIAVAAFAMYASFLPTGIAADFRYLFGAIPLVMILLLLVLLGGSREEQINTQTT
jgi:hypothetical protein